MKITLLLSLLAGSLLLFQSCKDKDSKGIPPEVSISSVSNILAHSVKATGYISSSGSSGVTMSGFCYSTRQNPTTSDMVAKSSATSGDLNLTITNLRHRDTYYIRAFASNSTSTGYSDQLTFTTGGFDLDYAKIYPESSSNYYRHRVVFSVEGGVHTVYGVGFTSVPITVRMIARKDKADVVITTVTVVNDETLTFQVPAEVLGQNPYIETRQYYVMLNSVLYNSFYAYLNNKINNNDGVVDTAIFILNNKDLNIRKVVAYSESHCTTYAIHGSFASETTLLPPRSESLSGVLARPASRRLMVKSDGQLLRYYPIPNGAPTCGTAGILYEIYDSSVYPLSLHRFHDAGQVQLKETLPSGVLTFQVENTMSDGSVVLTNEFSYTN